MKLKTASELSSSYNIKFFLSKFQFENELSSTLTCFKCVSVSSKVLFNSSRRFFIDFNLSVFVLNFSCNKSISSAIFRDGIKRHKEIRTIETESQIFGIWEIIFNDYLCKFNFTSLNNIIQLLSLSFEFFNIYAKN